MSQEELLDIYTDYLISQNKYATATGLEALLEGEVSKLIIRANQMAFQELRNLQKAASFA